jgi:GMP synthase-like glutamine amidotransferase
VTTAEMAHRAPPAPGARLRLAVLRHEPETGLGAFAAVLGRLGVAYDVLSTHEPLPAVVEYDGTIVLGGSLDIDHVLPDARRWLGDSVRRGLPCFAVCLGAQLLADALGARIFQGQPELGVHDIYLLDAARHDPLFADLPDRIKVFSFHEHSFDLAPDAIPLAGSLHCAHHAFRFGVAAYGFQFHPEVRAEDLGRWSTVPGYRRLLTENDGDWNGLTAAVAQVTPELDRFANELLRRWLHLAAAIKTLRERPLLAA